MILMINHIHWADPFMVLGAVGRTVIAMTKVEMFEIQ